MLVIDVPFSFEQEWELLRNVDMIAVVVLDIQSVFVGGGNIFVNLKCM